MRIFIVAQREQHKDHTQAVLKIVCYLLFAYLRPSFQYIKVQKPENGEKTLNWVIIYGFYVAAGLLQIFTADSCD